MHLLKCHLLHYLHAIKRGVHAGETERRLADRFREQLRGVEKNDTDASKPVARHFSLPNHSQPQHDYLRASFTPREQKSETKIHLSTGYTL